jgi:serine/threonine-protein kinase
VEGKKQGDLVEGYRVLSELGKGAASLIYLVQDPRTKQIWAMKHVEKDSPKDQRFLDQAEAEYQVASKLDHPGIRRITRMIRKKRQFITVKELYLVMELVDGQSLERHRPTKMIEAVDIFHQVAQALAYMHERGFVHADMKPNNVIVSDQNVAKIIDLGQSCKTGTVKPRIQGTPDYIAPEQVHRRPITPKTDLYNLGASMYWVLTGTHIPTAMPKGNSLVSSLDDDFIERPRPVHELCPAVHPKLEELIMECVEVDASKRPNDMHGVADRLSLILGILRAAEEREKGDASPAA